MLAAGGLWLALPVTGLWCCGSVLAAGRRGRWSPVATWGFATAIGVAVWSVPLLLAAELGLYRPWGLGLFGWVVVLAFARQQWRLRSKTLQEGTEPSEGLRRATGWDRWEVVLALGLLAAAGLLWGFPSESVLGGVDQGVYTNIGAFLAREGHLEIPLPSDGLDDPVPALEQIPGFRLEASQPGTPPHLTPQFAHLFPAWLAQAQGTLGLPGLLRLNGLLALVALACFHATGLALVTRPVAVVATLFLAFNPALLWSARITLSETLAQLLVWAGLALLVRLFSHPGAAPWAGFVLGLVALARVDGFVLLPLVFLAHGAMRILGRGRFPASSDHDPWPAFYQTAIPTFAFAATSYALWSPFYLDGMAPYLAPVGVVALVALFPVLALTPSLRDLLRRCLRPRVLRVTAVLGLVVVSVWAYGIRPIPQPTEEESRQWQAAQQAAVAEGVSAPRPEGGGPNWGRNTLSNLGRYLSPLVIALALIAVGWGLWRAFELRIRPALLVFLVVWGGFAVAYLYDPAVDPLHFWAIRRFVPLVLPGFVLAAALGWRLGSRRLPARGRRMVAVVLGLVLAAHTVWVSGPLAFFSRDAGVIEQLRAVAEALPEDEVVLVPTFRKGWAQWSTPIHFVFERRLHPFDPKSTQRMARVVAWIDRQRDAGRAVHLLVEEGTLPEGCCPGKKHVGRFPLDRQILEPTFWPVPRTVRSTQQWLVLYRFPGL